MTQAAIDIIVDPEFRQLIPPLTPDERAQLEANLLADGCRDALVVWAGENILLDGHNRLDICQAHGIEFDVYELDLADRDAAKNWIDTNQLGRRNLTPDFISLLRGRIYERTKQAHGGAREASYQNDNLKTSQVLADKFGVSQPTILRDAQFARAVDALRDVAPDLESDIVSGLSLPKSTIIDAAKVIVLEPEKAKELLSGVRNILHSSESVEWYTPAPYVDAARELFGGVIDLDPASCEYANNTIRSVRYFTKDDNGLNFEWHGRVWLNPPYGRDEDGSRQETWSRYLINQYKSGNCTEAVLLVIAAPGNKWFYPLWEFPICFPDHRIKFYGENGGPSMPTHSNAIVYFGNKIKEFHRIFSKFGVIAVKYDGI